MKRRQVFASLGIGSAALVSGGALARSATAPAAARHEAGHGQEEVISGPLASATVAFGQWRTDPPYDRFAVPNDRFRNEHLLTPNEVKIKAGGAVSFVISGLHNVQIFGNGTEPGDIDKTKLHLAPPLPPVIDDERNRIYRGLDPRLMPDVQDRVETVTFAEPGQYLVICGVLPHFEDNMFGFVTVLP